MVQLGAYEYDESKLLGEGSFAKVYLGNRVGNPLEIVAVKVIDISKCDSRFTDEINILQKLQSEYIVKIFDHVIRAQQQKCYLILEYCDEGTLADVNPKLNRFQAMRFFLQIVEGMKVLDKNKIIHRDLKLENILVHKGVAKITDFGFAKRMLANQLLVHSVKCGSPATMAPEIYLNNQQYQQYSMKNDIFSLAVILHELFYKIHPYNYEQQRLQNRDRVKVSNPHNLVEDFIQRALQHNPHLRMGFEQLFEHELIITFKDFLELDNMGNPVSDDYLLKKLGNQFKNIDPENHQEMQRKKQFWNQLIERDCNNNEVSVKEIQQIGQIQFPNWVGGLLLAILVGTYIFKHMFV
ncbi:Protein kinase-like domain [Pseudocohnilembus persalinus]|uniref:Protein kinase-like domain n=1 Tax=Pseudocohnilembus persalinus TaxID=266149 RepID=A0A0V0QYQ3_PSEPJ|nr:Protein kinase-like domain [Pseudocohnilembus persalinus]|eukprot:KRX07016.1 Protein kinase-like domain [Pseudocohnilembus persalinus]